MRFGEAGEKAFALGTQARNATGLVEPPDWSGSRGRGEVVLEAEAAVNGEYLAGDEAGIRSEVEHGLGHVFRGAVAA